MNLAKPVAKAARHVQKNAKSWWDNVVSGAVSVFNHVVRIMPTFLRQPSVLLTTLVVLAHGALLLQWHRAPATSQTKQPTEMTVSLDLPASVTSPSITPQATVQPAKIPDTVKVPQPTPATPQTQPTAPSTAAATLPVSAATPSAATTTTVAVSAVVVSTLPDREPDYQASYLNNPKPSYPNIANRMGWQGTVVVNVEVLATGLAGQLSLQRSSGHAVLDDAALQAIRNWRFAPARHNGQLVTKHFLIPIPFVFKENDE